MERYEPVRDLGSGNFGVAKLMRDRSNGELVAIKFIERGERVDRNVEREICNHRLLNHPNIVGFKEVFLTPSHLGIVMEFAAGGELFERIVRAGRFGEDEARYFFQQLISGVDYCHASGICHRDLKLENTLLDGNPAPRLKICDFGYSKSAFDSQPKSTVGTPAYIAPEVLQRKEYNGQPADVWSCGVTLYVMLVGAYPFEDPADPRNFRKTIQRIMGVKYSFPTSLQITPECQDLISRIFIANPAQRITIAEIRRHPWFQKNLPAELANPDHYSRNPEPPQSLDEIRVLIRAARTVGDAGPRATSLPLEFNEDDYMDADIAADGSLGLGSSGFGAALHAGGHPGSTGGSSGAASGGGGGPAPAPGAYMLDGAYGAQAAAHPVLGAVAHGAHAGVPSMGIGGVAGMPLQLGVGMPPHMGGVGGMGMAYPHDYAGQGQHAAAVGGYMAVPPRGGYAAAGHQPAVGQYGTAQHPAAARGVAAGYGAAQGYVHPQQHQQQSQQQR